MHLEVCSECCAEVIDFRDSLATMRAASLAQSILRRKPSLRDSIRAFPSLFRLIYPFRVPAIVALTLLAIVAAFVVWRARSPQQQAQSKGSASNNQGIAQQSSPIPVQPSPDTTIPGLKSPLAGMKPPKAPSRTVARMMTTKRSSLTMARIESRSTRVASSLVCLMFLMKIDKR